MMSPKLPHRSRASRNRSCSSGIYLISAAWSACLVTGNPEIEIVRFRNAGIVCLTQQEAKWAIDWVMQPDLLAEA